MEEGEPRVRRKGIYLLPNALTTGTLFGGFYAIVSSMDGHFLNAAYGILAAMICDVLDGRIARLTNTASDFGKEYDSLCDMVAFGIAPAMVIYSYSLHFLSEVRVLDGKLGWVVAFVYAAAAALRLARFNVYVALDGGKSNFFGLPSPSAAAVVVFYVWLARDNDIDGSLLVAPSGLLTFAIAVLMVSNFRYNSFKQLKVVERVPFIYLLVMISGLALITLKPPLVLFLGFFCYAMSGPTATVWRRIRRRRAVPSEPQL
jgi:CDP-diacylglycerol--serine O-phosphatidyltransferase